MAIGLGLLAVVACDKVSSERIAQWKGTQKGPGKIEAALRSSSVEPRLRAEAAAALVDLGMPEKVDELMAALPAAERWEIIKSLIPLHVAIMNGPTVPKARDARDALFGVRQYAPPEEQRQIDAAVLASLEADLGAGRFTGGRHSLDKMLIAMGPAAGPMLVKLLGAPDAPYKGLAELLVKVGDEATRDKGGAALVRRAAAEKQIPNDLWIAMGSLGGRTVADYLVEKVKHAAAAQAAQAAMALQQSRFPSVLPLALKVAGDAKADKLLRDEMFGVVEKIGGPQAQKGLVAIIAGDRDELVRYRAFEAALAVGQAEAVLPALQAFAPNLAFKRDDVVDFLVKDISKLGPAARDAVLGALASPSPLARMAAVLALEAPLPGDPRASLGTAADVAALLKLKEDRGTLKGFPAGTTVGSEAERVAAVLQKRGG
jgi:HEAT repeat protein